MQATRFAASNCHTVQRQVVLQVMGEGLVQANGGDVVALRNMANELSVWFPKHAQTMDAALALHLRRVGHDSLTGKVQDPGALPANLIQGCSAGECIGAATV